MKKLLCLLSIVLCNVSFANMPSKIAFDMNQISDLVTWDTYTVFFTSAYQGGEYPCDQSYDVPVTTNKLLVVQPEVGPSCRFPDNITPEVMVVTIINDQNQAQYDCTPKIYLSLQDEPGQTTYIKMAGEAGGSIVQCVCSGVACDPNIPSPSGNNPF